MELLHKKYLTYLLLNISIASVFVACTPTEVGQTGNRSLLNSGASNGGTINYGPDTALVMVSNPVVAMGGNKDRVSSPIDLSRFATTRTFINNFTKLEVCEFNTDSSNIIPMKQGNYFGCFGVLDEKNEYLARGSNGWTFNANSSEFLQVNTYYHMQKAADLFMASLQSLYNIVHISEPRYFPGAYPINGIDVNPGAYWLTELGNDSSILPKKLLLKPVCNIENNAAFSPATFEICFGYLKDYPTLFMAQDPSVIYHEIGHALVESFMNARNDQFPYKATLGSLFYDEAGAINEGIADYFTYLMTKRESFGEWALGKYLFADRPMSEASSLHPAFIRNDPNARISYPDFINFNVYAPTVQTEDIHYTGQIVSHFLVRLTKDISNKCSMSVDNSGKLIFGLIGETLSEIGDLTGKLSDHNQSETLYNNLNPDQSFLWSQVVNPGNFRRFFKIFARNIFYNVVAKRCLTTYTKDHLEAALDEYGLLLFSTYDDNLTSTDGVANLESNGEEDFPNIDFSSRLPLNPVELNNRQKTTLTTKDSISLITAAQNTQNTTRPIAYIFDRASDVNKALSVMTFMGKPHNPSSSVAGTQFNNGNSRVSPGEIVGISLNLLNNSNVAMSGVEILANDWDHTKYVEKDPTQELKPCQFNNFPTEAQGGMVDSTEDELTEGDCGYTTRNNGKSEEDNPSLDPVTPICLVEYRSANSTQFITQEKFRKMNGIGLHECINSDAEKNAEQNNECLVKVLDPSQNAFFSKIDPQKTFAETLKGSSTSSVPLNSSSVVFMEVNKWITPGTTFVCRFRVRFNNCSDCYENPELENDDFADFEYAGAKPFKVIDFKFVVID
jgi:hypothetical protein